MAGDWTIGAPRSHWLRSWATSFFARLSPPVIMVIDHCIGLSAIVDGSINVIVVA
jgi:hypothetical protein